MDIVPGQTLSLTIQFSGGVMTILMLIAHLCGDYILQSSWMAQEKTKRWIPAMVHACVYYLPFCLIFRPTFAASLVIVLTHALIDRYRLAKYLSFASQFLAPKSAWNKWSDCYGTGYIKTTPPFMAAWLMIIVDNTLHLCINYWALTHLMR